MRPAIVTYALSCVVVGALAYLTGWTNNDLQGIFAPWGRLALQYGIGGAYDHGPIDNGPIALALYLIPAWFEKALNLAGNSHADPFLFKLIPLTGLFAAPIFLRALLEATGARPVQFQWLILATVTNPAFVYSTAVWGQNDVLQWDLVAGSAAALLRGRTFLGAVLIAIAILVKPTPIVALPALAALGLRTRRPIGALAGVAVALLLVLPATIVHGGFVGGYGWLGDLFVRATQEYPYASVGAGSLENLLVGHPGLAPDAHHALSVALVVLAAATIILLALGDRTLGGPSTLWYLAASSTLIYWLAPRMHERYLTIGALFALAWAFAAQSNAAKGATAVLSAALFAQTFAYGILDVGWGTDVFSWLNAHIPATTTYWTCNVLNLVGVALLVLSRPASTLRQTLSDPKVDARLARPSNRIPVE